MSRRRGTAEHNTRIVGGEDVMAQLEYRTFEHGVTMHRYAVRGTPHSG